MSQSRKAQLKRWIIGLRMRCYSRTHEVVRRQGARDRTSDGEEIGKFHLTLETKADPRREGLSIRAHQV